MGGQSFRNAGGPPARRAHAQAGAEKGETLILADTSVWIELLNGRLGATLAPEMLRRIVTCGPVVQEVLQGLRRRGPAYDSFRDSFLAMPTLSDPLRLDTFLSAAEIYREGRRRGVTIRSSTDCLIAAIAMENDVAVWHRDRDYAAIAKFTNLVEVERFPAPP